MLDELLVGAGIVALGGGALYAGSVYGLFPALLKQLGVWGGGPTAKTLCDALVVYADSGSREAYAKVVRLMYSWTELVRLGVLPGTGRSGGNGWSSCAAPPCLRRRRAIEPGLRLILLRFEPVDLIAFLHCQAAWRKWSPVCASHGLPTLPY